MESLLNFFLNGLGLRRDQLQFLMRSSWFMVVSIHILWVCGWLTYLGSSVPFARAETTEQIAHDLTTDRIERLDTLILNVRVAQCRSAPNSPARDQYGERLQDLINRYVRLAHEQPRVPRCDEV